MRNLILVACAFALVGCAQQPKTLWIRADGQRAAGDAVLSQQFEMDRTICTGERSKANLSGVTVASGTAAAIIASQQRGAAADDVGRGCMAEKGYILVLEEEAEARREELAAIAAQKKAREASLQPTASARKR